MADERTTIFLSYAHADTARAKKVAEALERSGYDVWWDALIEGGAQYNKRIREALDSADAVVVLWSAASVESDWVCDEASQGRDRKRLVPVSLDTSAPPLGFRQYQTIRLRTWRGNEKAAEFQALLRAIGAVAGGAAEPRRAVPVGVDRRRALLIGGSVAAVAAAGGVGAWQLGLFGAGRPDGSIAVLGFKNLSGDPAQDYLSAGLTEQVRAALSRNPALKVLGAASSAAASEAADGPKAVAKKLNVENLLDGSIQRSGDQVRVAVNLIDGRTGFASWSQTLDRKLSDVFAFQNEIARLVARAMAVRVATEEPAPGGTTNVRAYEELLKGRALYLSGSGEDSDRQAMAHYEVAITADPDFALAHAALSRVLSSLAASAAQASELNGLYDRAIAQAERAIALAPQMPEGHLALGYALFAGRLDARAARPAYEKAAQLGAGDADILLLYAFFAAKTRRTAAAREAIGRALALDPLNPRTWRAAGSIDVSLGRPAEALGRIDRALALNPRLNNAHSVKGFALVLLGRNREALKEFAAEPGAMTRLTGLAIAHAKAGNQAAAQKAYDELVARFGDAALYQQAQVMAQWGRKEEAMARLERARAVGDSGLTGLVTDPLLKSVERDPRFAALARSLGFA